MDIFAPTAAGPWPLVVILPGGFMPPDQVLGYTDDFGLAIADRGAVVMTANWRQSRAFGASETQSLADAACAVGVARATGPAYGGDASRVVLVGHSNGAWPTSIIGLTESPADNPTACNLTAGSLRPDAIAVIAGNYSQAALDLVASDSAQVHIPVVIAQGGQDNATTVAAARSFQALLTSNGWDSTLIEAPDASHPGILYEPSVLDAIMALTREP